MEKLSILKVVTQSAIAKSNFYLENKSPFYVENPILMGWGIENLKTPGPMVRCGALIISKSRGGGLGDPNIHGGPQSLLVNRSLRALKKSYQVSRPISVNLLQVPIVQYSMNCWSITEKKRAWPTKTNWIVPLQISTPEFEMIFEKILWLNDKI